MANENPYQPYQNGDGAEVATEQEQQLKKPPLYRVVLLNDDYTPMGFVVWILQNVFHKPLEEATRVMLRVHTQGKGVCGVYSYDIAQTKVFQVKEIAKKQGHPLECVMEVEESEE